jgi:hypothetical protein
MIIAIARCVPLIVICLGMIFAIPIVVSYARTMPIE